MYRITIDESINTAKTESIVVARNDYGEATKIYTWSYQGKDYQVIYKQIFESINIPVLIKYLQTLVNK